MHGARAWLIGGPRGRQWLRSFCDNALAVEQFDLDGKSIMRRLQILNEAIDIEAWTRREDILRSHENVLDKGRRHDPQRNFTIDAAEGEIVDLVTKRRDVGAFRGIQIHREHVLSLKIEVRRQFKREWSVSALVFPEAHAVDPDRGRGHRSFKVNEDMLSSS